MARSCRIAKAKGVSEGELPFGEAKLHQCAYPVPQHDPKRHGRILKPTSLAGVSISIAGVLGPMGLTNNSIPAIINLYVQCVCF